MMTKQDGLSAQILSVKPKAQGTPPVLCFSSNTAVQSVFCRSDPLPLSKEVQTALGLLT